MDDPAYYCYTIPRPVGIEEAPVRPQEAKWNPQFSEFILMYDDVRKAGSRDLALPVGIAARWNAFVIVLINLRSKPRMLT